MLAGLLSIEIIECERNNISSNKILQCLNCFSRIYINIHIGTYVYLHDPYLNQVATHILHLIFVQPQRLLCQTFSLTRFSKNTCNHTIHIIPHVFHKNIINGKIWYPYKDTNWRNNIINHNYTQSQFRFSKWYQSGKMWEVFNYTLAIAPAPAQDRRMRKKQFCIFPTFLNRTNLKH